MPSRLRELVDSGRRALDPSEAREFLASYGITMPPQALARGEADLPRIMHEVPAPVALKIVSPDVSHKSDLGGVRLGITSEEEARQAYREIVAGVAKAGVTRIDGVLVQKMEPAQIELIVGTSRDDVFGPTLMFGVGGKLTELYRDVATCVYPWKRTDLWSMPGAVKGGRLLHGYRGGPVVELRPLVDLLEGVGRAMIENPEIVGIDLNPVVPDDGGGFIALDSRILIGDPHQVRAEKPADPRELEPLFEPKSIAVIGASDNPEKISGMIAPRLIKFGFPRERLYLVNPNRNSILDLVCYKNVKDVTEEIDAACIVVPPKAVEDVLREAGERRVRTAIIFSSGFGEAGNLAAQERLRVIAKEYGMRICGPNTEGVVSPPGNACITFSPTVGSFASLQTGGAAIVTQSGGIMVYLLGEMMEVGCGVSRAVSSANEADLELADYLNFFATDSATKVVGAFLEGVRNGPKFVSSVINLTRAKKPLVVLKAGKSDEGALAAKFHTGAMTGSYEVYRALFRQLGIIEARDVEEVADYLLAFSLQPVPAGNRLVVISASGGANTMIADWCGDMGLNLAPLSSDAKKRLGEVLPEFAGLRNPIDLTGEALSRPALFETVLKELVEEGDVFLILRVGGGTKAARSIVDCAKLYRERGKTLVTCWMTAKSYAEESRKLLVQNSIPMYPSPMRAMNAIRAMVGYRRSLGAKDDLSGF